MNASARSSLSTPRARHRAALRLVALLLFWMLFSGATLRSCLKPTKPSQLNAVHVDVDAIPIANDDATLAEGRKLYMRHCLQCHLPDGSGGVGANLTDDQWVLGSDLSTILRVISAGTTNGMPGWSGMLSPEDIGAVTAYLYSMNPHIELPKERLTP